MEAAGVASDLHEQHHDDHHGPPAPHFSSSVDPQTLGMYLFIISEIMLFGAFFTAYFFIRVVKGDSWPAAGHEIPVLLAGINTAILVSSSFTMHWALEGIKNGNKRALRVGLLSTFLLGLTFLSVQVNEYFHLGWAIHDNAQGTIFYGLTGLHGAHVTVGLILLGMATVRAFRGHFSPESHRGVEVPGIYWHFVDIMWLVVFFALYIL
ncbi:MAG: cytochrome c oxidase subunit [Thermoleophilaceae bacterium]|jgi:cytochrome c oxidase subunit 3|nr:cytochrome c oxidase subunit [Thermoleophilaceae bacterium]